MWNPFRKRKKCLVSKATPYQLGDLIICIVHDIAVVNDCVEIYYGEVSLEIVIDGVSKGSFYYTTLRNAAQSPQRLLKLIQNRVKA